MLSSPIQIAAFFLAMLPAMGDDPPLADEAKALAAWAKVYHLEHDQVIKRVAPPYIPERLAGAERQFPFLKDRREGRGFPVSVIYHVKDDKVKNASITLSGSPDDKGRWLIYLLESVAGVVAQDVEGPKELLQTTIAGDFLVRDDAPKDDVVAAMQTILWLECGQKINLRFREIERDVVIARGRYKFTPRVEGQDGIDLYGATVGANGNGGGTGKFDKFLDQAGQFMEPKLRIINEVDKGPDGDVSWRFNARSPFTEADRIADHDATAVLKHLEEQTGLKYVREKRKVRVLFVEPGT